MSENGHSEELRKLKEERDSYQRAAVTAESNELTLHRQLSGYMSAELEQLRSEVQMWRRRDEEGAQEALDEQDAREREEVSEPS